jgi:hypothetical protein
MGAWGGLCTFDYAGYIQQVVPAFRSGERHPIIQQALMLMRREPARKSTSTFQGLAQLAPYFDPLMTNCALGRMFSVCDGVLLPGPDPDHSCIDRWDYEDLADLFERVLTRHTIGHYTVLGLSFTSVEYLLPPELELDDTTRLLIDLLDQRCLYWAAGTGGYGEGVRGWLDPEETQLLALGLAAFSSLTAEAQSGAHQRIHPLWLYESESEPAYAHHVACIMRFMTILRQATALGYGVLWGRDLRLFYGHSGLFAAEETAPEKLYPLTYRLTDLLLLHDCRLQTRLQPAVGRDQRVLRPGFTN